MKPISAPLILLILAAGVALGLALHARQATPVPEVLPRVTVHLRTDEVPLSFQF